MIIACWTPLLFISLECEWRHDEVIRLNCEYCGHRLSEHGVNYYASGLIRVKCFIDSFVDEESKRYYKCKCEDILVDMSWIIEDLDSEYYSQDEIISGGTSSPEPFKNLATK